MVMHKVEYEIQLTGSKLFDIVTFNTASKLCEEFPGLEMDYVDEKHIRIFGELNDYWYGKYKEKMFGEGE